MPLVVPGLSTGSSSSATPTPPNSSLQDSENSSMRIATKRSESVSERAQGDLLPETTTKTETVKNGESKRARRNALRELPGWL